MPAGGVQAPVDPADEVTVGDVADEQIQRIGGLIESAIAEPGSGQRAIREVVGLGACEPALVVPAIVKMPVAAQLGTGRSFSQAALDHMPRGETVAIHEVLRDLVRNALIAQCCDKLIKQGRGIPAADSLSQVFPVGPETGFVNERLGAGQMADPLDQTPSVGEGRIVLCR
jgi:hypothetical protein